MGIIKAIREVIHSSMAHQILVLKRELEISKKKRSQLEKDLTEIRIYLAKRHKIHSV